MSEEIVAQCLKVGPCEFRDSLLVGHNPDHEPVFSGPQFGVSADELEKRDTRIAELENQLVAASHLAARLDDLCYRRLQFGEITRQGDEFEQDDGSWIPTSAPGCTVNYPEYSAHAQYRRSLADENEQLGASLAAEEAENDSLTDRVNELEIDLNAAVENMDGPSCRLLDELQRTKAQLVEATHALSWHQPELCTEIKAERDLLRRQVDALCAELQDCEVYFAGRPRVKSEWCEWSVEVGNGKR